MDQREKIVKRVNENIPNQETPHIGMAYLLAVAKRCGLRTKYVDMVMDAVSVEDLIELVRKTTPRLIGLTAFTVQIRTAADIAGQIKAQFPKAVVCVGGPHPIGLPTGTLDEFPAIDFVVCGEGEGILPRLVESVGDESRLAQIPGIVTRGGGSPNGAPVEDLDALPYPAWDEFDLSKYPGTYPHRTRLELPMVSGRGCPYRCTFCCRALGDRLRRRSVGSVIGEIEHNIERYGCESVAFLDETFVLNLDWAEEFFATMIRRGLSERVSWSCSTRVSNVTPELLARMRQAGCYYIFYGMESADDLILKRIKKGITVEQIRSATQWTKEAGIIPVGAFIIGLPGDTEEHVFKAIDLADELDLYSVTFPVAVPFPGTELREAALRCEHGMRILSNNWDYYGKQDPGVMESDALSRTRRKELQQIAYARHPKKNLDAYLRALRPPRSPSSIAR
jgi:radical SAM superfamily enzyme YgiQ (UPF0313 family)